MAAVSWMKAPPQITPVSPPSSCVWWGRERLWDIAKAYGTTSRDIIQANGLEEELAPEGQLLLIPRKR